MPGTNVLAIDSGTTSCRAIVFGPDGAPIATAQREFTQRYPQPGWVEHDAAEIWETQWAVTVEAARQAGVDTIGAIGITNQRETIVAWDRRTGDPLCPAIVWQCRRTSDDCQRHQNDGAEPIVREKTGLLLDPYFSATKIAWMLREVPGLRTKAERGDALFGTIDTWLLWKLTGGAVHATEVGNASRTLLLDLRTRQWDESLLALFGVPAAALPQVRPSGMRFGETEIGGVRIPISAMLGDQQAALYGQGCHAPGMAKSTYGTGCFLLLHSGSTPAAPGDGLLSTIGWEVGDEVAYALEGSVFVAGAAVQWLRDGLGLIGAADETEALARSVPDTGGVHFVPAFTGLGAPYWRPDARGMLTGLTRGTTRAHIARAALEAIAFQNRDVLDAMNRSLDTPIRALRVDGGASRNDFLMQFQADLLGIPVERPAHHETTALGAAALAARVEGLWATPLPWRADRTFTPEWSQAQRDTAYDGWRKAVSYQV